MISKKAMRMLALCGVAVCLLATAVAVADEFDITRWSIDGGGVMHSSGGQFEVSGTIGQPDAGTMSGGDFVLNGGFWFPLAPGDCNSDGGVNLFDFDDLEPCLTGPAGAVSVDCRCFDLDRDGDIDLTDVAGFQETFTGA